METGPRRTLEHWRCSGGGVLSIITVVLYVLKSSCWVVNYCREEERGGKEHESEKYREKQRVARPQISSPGPAMQRLRQTPQRAPLSTVLGHLQYR